MEQRVNVNPKEYNIQRSKNCYKDTPMDYFIHAPDPDIS